MLKVALSHDIDRTKKTYQYLTKLIQAIYRADLRKIKGQLNSFRKGNPYWTFDEFIKIEESYGIRSTVFFLNESMKFNILKPGTFSLACGRYKILSDGM